MYSISQKVNSSSFDSLQIAEEIPGIDAICSDCAGKATECAQFINKCKQSSALLLNVLENLYITLNNLHIKESTTNDRQKLYVNISEHNIEFDYEVAKEISQQTKKRKKRSNKIEKKTHFECSECKECLATIQEVINHNATYHSCVTCNICLDIFPNETELEFHMDHKHKYKCEECPQICSTKEILERHWENAHRPFCCKDCGKSCKGLDKLHAHELNHNTESNICPKCGKKYQTRSFFEKHANLCIRGLLDPHPIRSDRERTFSCEKCGKGYSTSGGFRVHMRFEHGNAKYHVCDQCGKKFTAPSTLKTHMVTHTGEKNFECDICHGKFVSKEALLYHTRRHTGVKPFSCHICDERFVNASARAEHIKYKHVGPKLQCQLCLRKFVTTYFLKKHFERHHDPRSKLFVQNNVFEF